MNVATQLSRIEIPIVLIKEYVYCPRIAFYKYFTVWEPPTESMKYPRYTKLYLARLLRSYGIEGEIYMEYPVKSRKLGIYGKVDAVVVNGRKLYVVEVKLDTSRSRIRRKTFHYLAQIVAYVMATEETLKRIVDRALVAVLAREEVFEVRVTPLLRRIVSNTINEFRRYLERQELPPPTPRRTRCFHCFYRKICPR